MPVNLAKMKEKEEELKRASGGQFWDCKEGKSRVRLVPPPEGMDEFYGEGGFHYKVGPELKTFSCPRLGNVRADCWICAKIKELEAGDDDNKLEAKEMRAQKKFIVPIIDLNDKDDDGLVKGPIQYWMAGSTAFKQIISYFTDDQYGDISDPDTGTNLTVIKTGKGMKTEYDVRADKQESKWPEELDELLDEIADPWTILNFATNADMEAAFQGTGSGGGSKSSSRTRDDNDGEAPTESRRGRGGATTGRSRPPRGEAPAFEDEKAPDEDGSPVDPEPADVAPEPAARHADRASRSRSAPATEAAKPVEGASRRLGRALRSA